MSVWFKVAVGFVASWGLAAVVVAVMYVHPDATLPWQFRLLREPVWSGAWAAAVVGLVYWRCGAPGSTIWRVAFDAGVRQGVQQAGAAQGNVVPMPRRVQS